MIAGAGLNSKEGDRPYTFQFGLGQVVELLTIIRLDKDWVVRGNGKNGSALLLSKPSDKSGGERASGRHSGERGSGAAHFLMV